MGPFQKFFDFNGDGELNAIEFTFWLNEIERIENEVENTNNSSVDWKNEEDLDNIELETLDLDDLDINEF